MAPQNEKSNNFTYVNYPTRTKYFVHGKTDIETILFFPYLLTIPHAQMVSLDIYLRQPGVWRTEQLSQIISAWKRTIQQYKDRLEN